MEAVFKICKLPKKNTIQIVGLEQDNDAYLKPGNVTISKRQYLYTETATINIVRSVTLDGEGTPKAMVIEHPEDSVLDSCDMSLEKDGMYTVSHIILPTMKWLLRVLETSRESINLYSVICIYDELSDDIYLYNKDKNILDLITVEDLLQLPYEVNNMVDPAPSIIRLDKNTFVMDSLIDCHVHYCNLILQSEMIRCGRVINSQNKYIRDVLWCAINVIKYHLSFNNIYEAQRILERISNCTELCKVDNYTSNSSSCGCSR